MSKVNNRSAVLSRKPKPIGGAAVPAKKKLQPKAANVPRRTGHAQVSTFEAHGVGARGANQASAFYPPRLPRTHVPRNRYGEPEAPPASAVRSDLLNISRQFGAYLSNKDRTGKPMNAAERDLLQRAAIYYARKGEVGAHGIDAKQIANFAYRELTRAKTFNPGWIAPPRDGSASWHWFYSRPRP